MDKLSKKVFILIMAIMFIAMGWIIYTIPAGARTAIVKYNANEKEQVAIVVGSSPDFTATLKAGQEITGQMGKDGEARITGLVPGKTYYFSAVGWDAAGNRTAFSPPIKKEIPPFTGLKLTALPAISTDNQTITLTIKIQGASK